LVPPIKYNYLAHLWHQKLSGAYLALVSDDRFLLGIINLDKILSKLRKNRLWVGAVGFPLDDVGLLNIYFQSSKWKLGM
jgi:hypothetical protein